jgi:transposase
MRGAFARELAKTTPEKRVYVDETGATTSMTRLYGRAPPGRRVVGRVPLDDWKVVSLVGALRLEGMTAALAFAGPTDAPAFETFLERCLCPVLRPGDLVVLDRLGAHRGPAVRRAIEAARARLLYLPPYSPDLSPIEPSWSKVKEHLRSVAARAEPDLIDAMGQALRSVTAADARGYFKHCGCAIH